MSSRFIAAASRALLCLSVALGLAGCKQEIHFTKAPAYGAPPPSTPRREPTFLAVSIPVDIAAARLVAAEAVPERLGRVVDWVHNAACARRAQWVECAGARVDIDLERKGPARLEVARGAVSIEVPLAYTLVARGLGWARDISETRQGQLVATVTIDAGLTGDFEPDVRMRDAVALSEPQLPALRTHVAIGPHVAARLRRPLLSVVEALRRELAAPGIREQTDRAWRALHVPIELNRDLQVWMRAEPERVRAVGFQSDRDGTVFRMAIQARIASFNGPRPTPLLPRPLPALAAEPAGELRTRLQLPVPISSDAMLEAVKAAFPASEILRTGDADGPTVSVRVRDANLLPARGLLSVELQLDVAEPGQFFGLIGSAHIVARPVFRAQSALLELEGLSFPDQPPPRSRSATPTQFPSSERERRIARGTAEPARGPRIGLEPFASRISKAARMDLSRLLRDVVPHANSALVQTLPEGIVLGGRFDEASIATIVPTREGFEVTFELTGALVMTAAPAAAGDGVAAQAARPGAERVQ